MNPDQLSLGNAAAVRLIAGREIQVRLRSKAFRVLTIVMVVIVVGLCVALKLLGGATSGGDKVGYLPAEAAIGRALPAVGDAIGQKITIVPVADQATGQQQVTNGDLDALLVGNGSQINLVVKKNIGAGLQHAVDVLAQQIALDQQITALHGDPAVVRAATAHATATIRPLQPPYPYQAQQLSLGVVAGVLIYVSLMLNGQTVAQGVVEEKSSRVVELLLATIRPWQLMAGKVAGIGIVGLIQML
ncbi:MAG TPA: ABC transporter permease, partial [Pseudonocardiaceae bacterium]